MFEMVSAAAEYDIPAVENSSGVRTIPFGVFLGHKILDRNIEYAPERNDQIQPRYGVTMYETI
ncbi:hypothetical protein AW168_35750 [Nocardia brasiliensis]|nr:hypothetical protein AW168_35750 [Nocardia brasiliensis]